VPSATFESVPYRRAAEPTPDAGDIEAHDDDRASLAPLVGKAIPRDQRREARRRIALVVLSILCWALLAWFWTGMHR
jgi:hypothetical protein